MLNVRTDPARFERVRMSTAALVITHGDLAGPILVRVRGEHIDQEKRIFSSEGKAGVSGKWTALSLAYARKKRSIVGRQKILVWDGTMREKFTRAGNKDNIAQFVQKGPAQGTYRLGARSQLGVYHFEGSDSVRTSSAGKVFSWFLPVRDMVSKTREQILEIRSRILRWYREERIPQVRRALARETSRARRAR